MLRLLLVFLSASFFAACSNNDQNVNLQEKLKQDTTLHAQQILFAEPQTIDSLPIVIYPLILEKESYESSYSSEQRTRYWNLIFYNTETGYQTLLTDKKILMHSINLVPSSSYSTELVTNRLSVIEENIIYAAVLKDYNANKQLDPADPTYLFASNKDGTNFRQISPPDFNISSWQFVKGTTKIIMQAQRDDNGDKIFNELDAAIPLVADMASQQQARETFSPGFTDSLKQKLVTTWKQ